MAIDRPPRFRLKHSPAGAWDRPKNRWRPIEDEPQEHGTLSKKKKRIDVDSFRPWPTRNTVGLCSSGPTSEQIASFRHFSVPTLSPVPCPEELMRGTGPDRASVRPARSGSSEYPLRRASPAGLNGVVVRWQPSDGQLLQEASKEVIEEVDRAREPNRWVGIADGGSGCSPSQEKRKKMKASLQGGQFQQNPKESGKTT